MSKITCTTGNNRGDEFALHEGKNVIGRSQDCQVTLFDKKCSRNHCLIIKKGKHYSIHDMESRNGTLLNGKPVPEKPKTCKIGDVIAIGRTRLTLSDKPLGSFLDQAATDAAADLQRGKYGQLLSSTSQDLRHHTEEKPKGFLESLKSLFRK